MIHLTELKKMFPFIQGATLIKKGSTSVIFEHKVHETMVSVFTTDEIKLKWFEEYKSRFGFRFISSKHKGSAYDENPIQMHAFVLKKMFPLTPEDKAYVNKNILSTFKEQEGKMQPNMICLLIATTSQDKKIKDLFFRMRKFIEENHVKFDLKLDSFMKMADGSIVCTDPFYTTR